MLLYVMERDFCVILEATGGAMRKKWNINCTDGACASGARGGGGGSHVQKHHKRNESDCQASPCREALNMCYEPFFTEICVAEFCLLANEKPA